MKFYICKHCGNVITKLTSAQVPVKCCGEEMHVLEAGVTDAAQEKHVPAVTVEGSLVKVDVGSVTHPMTAEHFIQWVVVETDRRRRRRSCSPWRRARLPRPFMPTATSTVFGRRTCKLRDTRPPRRCAAPGRSSDF